VPPETLTVEHAQHLLANGLDREAGDEARRAVQCRELDELRFVDRPVSIELPALMEDDEVEVDKFASCVGGR
jgi:hypothetical protein